MLNCCCNSHGSRTFTHGSLFDRSVCCFDVDHFITVSGDVDIFWIKVDQAFNGSIDFTGIVPFKGWQQLKGKNGFVTVLYNVDHVHMKILK